MKDQIAEKVMELYDQGTKQTVIAETLNLSKDQVHRIIKKYSCKEEPDNPDDVPPDDFTPENPETPGNSSEGVLSDNPDDVLQDDFTPENPETPGNTSEADTLEKMQTVAEMTSAQTAKKLTEGYKEVLDMMGSVTREIMENSVSGMDKATRMLLTATERMTVLSDRQDKQLADCEKRKVYAAPNIGTGTCFVFLVMALMLICCCFTFGGICGISGQLYLATGICGLLFASAVVLLFLIGQSPQKLLLTLSAFAVAAAVPALISGYFFFLIDEEVLQIWLISLAGVPVGGIIIIFYLIMQKRRAEK